MLVQLQRAAPYFMITHAAIRKDGVIYIGRRHCFIMHHPAYPKGFHKFSEQGFITESGKFLDREEGAKHALDCGQIKKLKYSSRDLFSEDLW